MVNKEYWNEFYKNNSVTNKETSFARYVLNLTRELKGPLIDVACGNGRDASFFASNGKKVTGIDLGADITPSNFEFIREDLFKHDYSKYEVIYLRFVVHTLTEYELDKLIDIFSLLDDVLIFIETRSTTGISKQEKVETYFKSSIGEEHFRMLYSKKYLDNKFYNFEILESSEGKYSKFGSDDPYCLRYILKR